MNYLIFEGMNKSEFLRSNSAYIDNLLLDINNELNREYHSEKIEINLVDIWVITYAEAGIDGQGHIAPHYTHSNGEVGMYPLPKNIKDWNGPSAPKYNAPHKTELNVEHYCKYIGHLKNKVVKHINSVPLYRDLFDGTGVQKEKDALILAGIIHGYFYSGNYSDGRVPLHHLIDGYNKKLPLSDLLRDTTYKHAGKSLIENRTRNLQNAVDDFKRL